MDEPLDPRAIVQALMAHDFGPYIGVPCSYLGPVLTCLEQEYPNAYLAAANEGEAVAIAAGAQLAGRQPVVILQNSGLGNAVNPLSSLCHTMRLPMLLLITWRGEPGIPEEPQHEVMGRGMQKILRVLEVENSLLPKSIPDLNRQLRLVREHMSTTGLPYSFTVPKTAVAKYSQHTQQSAGNSNLPLQLSRREEAIAAVMKTVPDATLTVATTGKTARELERDWDRAENLYVVGSMGCASSIALGLALNAPDRNVVVLDGDGAALMRLEALTTIGRTKPDNLLHIVLDNEAYESTGNQPTGSESVNLRLIAESCGYGKSHEIDSIDQLVQLISGFFFAERGGDGPVFIRLRIASGSQANLGRPKLKPPESAARFRNSLLSPKVKI